MRPTDIMRGSPPPPEAQVTKANWRTYPAIRWGFTHARELLPTAAIRRASQPTPLVEAQRELTSLAFSTPDGQRTTVAETLQATDADALIVMHRGVILTEWYGEGMSETTPHMLCSVSKSICGTLGGVLAARGLIDPGDKVTAYLPELAGTAYDGCTLRHLLDMQVGIRFEEDYDDPNGDVARYRHSSGWDIAPPGVPAGDQRGFLTTLRPSGRPHGKLFHYVSPNTDVCGWVYERACGAPYAKILSDYLWQPMGAAEDASITLDSMGAGRFAGGISATARDLARFGEMIRCRGLVQGRQVVPGAWIDDIHDAGDRQAWANGDLAFVFPDGCYRSNWYTVDVKRRDLAAVGIHGQWIYVDIASDSVIVKLATQGKAMDIAQDHRWLAGFRAITAHLS
ncbi:Putative beta-lactamase family protein; putative 6-aminohexanoate-dimer hydrolase [Bradyrhizobium sp. ORS 278]|uniref:serine hydrolase domain-containing protein n=1 Tax=Bradyrhizobium sp. (strain ORS 278) TaxID=114615 RepID=UPI0001508A16|nr:serine hydrolase [Bradyrhizobium sp. ORS 278]CAL80136.1 Putative beta-lactamase family protein; putative 6-aminohexanoate-dimer hydrolase [Bradyrhizobium sp. ORS 278]